MTSYEQAFRAWAEGEIAAALVRKPHLPGFTFDDLDGCTGAFDLAPECCVQHDIAYRLVESAAERRAADDALFACLARKAAHEDRFLRWRWHLTAWAFWAAVRLCGGLIIARRRTRLRRQETSRA